MPGPLVQRGIFSRMSTRPAPSPGCRACRPISKVGRMGGCEPPSN
ncbi:hypothetical protein C4K16_2107 [Pseudomonas chlororaphis subsp. aurantiaca]|nr:hypothetical protein C4K16_2107 [Pseudomonas chlororaphis subsp. aurantiaca]